MQQQQRACRAAGALSGQAAGAFDGRRSGSAHFRSGGAHIPTGAEHLRPGGARIQPSARCVPARMKLQQLTRLCTRAHRRTAVGVTTLALLTAPALAHDTWFERLSVGPGPVLLALGTGNQFPLRETGVGAEYLVQQGCSTAGAAGTETPAAAASALTAVRVGASALLLRGPAGAHSCWAQLQAFELEMPADKVALYLDEVNASAEQRAAWAQMQRRGLPWRERYTKSARIELGSGSPAGPGSAVAPVQLALDAQLQRQPDGLLFTVLRDGQPLPGQAVELRAALAAPGAAAPTGQWHRTDAQGRLRLPLPPSGRWLLRGIDLRPSVVTADAWESRFLTLAFDVD